MTFSICARCPETGQLGIAISSSSIAVGARCPWLLAGVGAVSSQNITLPHLGPLALEELYKGEAPMNALDHALASDPYSQYRQVLLIDQQGRTAAFSGEKTLGVFNITEGKDCIAGGNMLTGENVTHAMVRAFETLTGELSARLVNALKAGLECGGEAGPVHSAALKVVDKYPWPLVDLRVDWSEHQPISDLEKLWHQYAPEMNAYVKRALNPCEAPSYGVPGDE